MKNGGYVGIDDEYLIGYLKIKGIFLSQMSIRQI